MITDEMLLMELKQTMDEIGNGNPFPIDLDDVSRWLFYKLRQRLVTILTTKFTVGEHYREEEMLEGEEDFRDKDYKKYYVSVECFEKFCKFRKGSRGRKVHAMFVQVRKSVLDDDGSSNSHNSSSEGEEESDWEGNNDLEVCSALHPPTRAIITIPLLAYINAFFRGIHLMRRSSATQTVFTTTVRPTTPSRETNATTPVAKATPKIVSLIPTRFITYPTTASPIYTTIAWVLD